MKSKKSPGNEPAQWKLCVHAHGVLRVTCENRAIPYIIIFSVRINIYNNNNTCAYVIMSTRVLNYLYDLYCFFMQPRALIKRALIVFREQYSHADIMMAHSPTNTRK